MFPPWKRPRKQPVIKIIPKPNRPPLSRGEQAMVDTYLNILKNPRGMRPAIKIPQWAIDYVRNYYMRIPIYPKSPQPPGLVPHPLPVKPRPPTGRPTPKLPYEQLEVSPPMQPIKERPTERLVKSPPMKSLPPGTKPPFKQLPIKLDPRRGINPPLMDKIIPVEKRRIIEDGRFTKQKPMPEMKDKVSIDYKKAKVLMRK